MRRHTVPLCLILLFAIGCGSGRRADGPAPAPVPFEPVAEDQADYILVILFDLSGSYERLMTDEGKAWEFWLAVFDRYFRDRIGSNDRIIISQLSKSQKPLVFEGSPMQLREEFPSAEHFRKFLKSKADPTGSHIHDGINKSLEYLWSAHPGIATKRTRSAVLICSDMLDNEPGGEHSERRVMEVLKTYAKVNGSVGIYYADQGMVTVWNRRLAAAGFTTGRFIVQSEIVSRPSLPSFDAD